MEILATVNLMDLFLHLDKTLETVVSQYHAWIYLILFIVIFCETGLVVTPFLPGDSLLFAAGSLAAMQDSVLEIRFMWPLLFAAAVCGDNTNYWIGYLVGPKIFHKENVRILNKKHLEKTHRFYEKHGGQAVVIARFMPIFRTFVPFVAGIGRMTYWRFLAYSIGGTIAWTGTFVLGGYCFGRIQYVKEHFGVVILAIIVISFIPGIIAVLREKRRKQIKRQKLIAPARVRKYYLGYCIGMIGWLLIGLSYVMSRYNFGDWLQTWGVIGVGVINAGILVTGWEKFRIGLSFIMVFLGPIPFIIMILIMILISECSDTMLSEGFTMGMGLILIFNPIGFITMLLVNDCSDTVLLDSQN